MFNVVFTDEGRALIAEIASDIDYSLLISDVKFSDHDYTGQEATVTEATFTGDFASGTNTINVVDSTTMRIESSFDNRYINVQKDLYSIGIFAKCVKPNGMIYTEIDSGLLAVCTVSTPRIIPPYADAPFSVFSYNINLAVGSADNVTVVETQAGVQYKELATPLTINGTQETTVEGALGGLNDYGDALADNLAANENVYGAKNLIPYPYYRASPYTSNDVTFTVNADKSISLSGTATADTYYQLNSNTFADMYIGLNVTASVEGCIPGITFYGKKDSATVFNTNSNVTFVVPSYNGYLGLYIEVKSGTVTDGVTVYPMIRDARILDPTYVPPAETNLQLTQNKAERNDLSTIHATGSTNTTGARINAGTFFYLNGIYVKALLNIGTGDSFVENTNYKKDTVNGAIADLHKNQMAYNTAIDISSYTSTSNTFEVPADGYVILNAQTTPSGSSSLTIYGSDMSTSTNFVLSLISPTGNYQGTCAFVKKGMNVVCASLQVGHAAYYYPLT